MITTQLQFAHLPKVHHTAAGTTKTYKSQCGEFAVVETHPLGYRAYWLAVQCLANGNQSIISRKKTRDAAEKACEEFCQ